MCNFLSSARGLLDNGKLNSADAARFRNVFLFRNRHDSLEQTTTVDLTNIEHLFGLIDLSVRVDPESESVRNDLLHLILKTLECTIGTGVKNNPKCQVLVAKSWNEIASSIAEHFVSIVARRWQTRPENGEVRDSIVSLNYDLVIERAMEACGIWPDYGLPDSVMPPRTGGKVKMSLLKLHGSANWKICSNAGCHQIEIKPLTQDPEKWASEDGQCQKCGWQTQPFIVPPTWSKGEFREPLQSVWQQAFKELVEARRWVLIGTSLPETDRFLHYLFGLALLKNPELDEIVFLNKTRFEESRLFGNLPKRITFIKQVASFEDAVASSMQLASLLGQAEYSSLDPVW
jgi:hypothetical protein